MRQWSHSYSFATLKASTSTAIDPEMANTAKQTCRTVSIISPCVVIRALRHGAYALRAAQSASTRIQYLRRSRVRCTALASRTCTGCTLRTAQCSVSAHSSAPMQGRTLDRRSWLLPFHTIAIHQIIEIVSRTVQRLVVQRRKLPWVECADVLVPGCAIKYLRPR